MPADGDKRTKITIRISKRLDRWLERESFRRDVPKGKIIEDYIYYACERLKEKA